MTGSRAIALVDALDALGLLDLAPRLEKVIAEGRGPDLREIKDKLQHRAAPTLDG